MFTDGRWNAVILMNADRQIWPRCASFGAYDTSRLLMERYNPSLSSGKINSSTFHLTNNCLKHNAFCFQRFTFQLTQRQTNSPKQSRKIFRSARTSCSTSGGPAKPQKNLDHL